MVKFSFVFIFNLLVASKNCFFYVVFDRIGGGAVTIAAIADDGDT